MKTGIYLIVAAALSFSFAHAALAQCTMIGCLKGLTLNFDNSSWPAGSYDFTISADGTVYNCSGSLPLSCDHQNVRCDREGVMIGESGCALEPEAHGFYGITMEEIPSSISVTIKHESGRTHSFQAEPETNCSYPNGKGCDQEPCCSATLEDQFAW